MARFAHVTGRYAVLGLLLAAFAACPSGTPERSGSEPSAASLPPLLAHADAAFRDGDYREAQRTYERALEIEPGHELSVARLGTCYLKNRLVRKAQGLLEAHLETHPGDLASRLVLARSLIQQGELERAAMALRTVARANPDNLLAHYNLGFVDYRLRIYDEAEDHLKRTVTLRPDHPEANYTLGLVYLAQARYDEAIASLERTVEINPHHVGARFNLANACARAGRIEEAETHQAIYAEISGRNRAQAEKEAQIKASSVKAVEHLVAGNYPEALAEYQALVAKHPDYAPLFSQIGRLQLRLGRREQGFQALRKAADLDPDLSEPHYLLSTLYREMGDAQAADREMQIFTALESVPGKPSYY